LNDEAPRYPVTPQHPPRLVRVRLQWEGRILEAARVPHPRTKKIVWVRRRKDGSDQYLPPKHATKGPNAWAPEPEWWQPLHPEKWDAPLPLPLPPLEPYRLHDGKERMVTNVRGRPRRSRQRAGDRDALPADDKPWWWDATAIRYEPPGKISRDMAEGRLMRALAVSGAGTAGASATIENALVFHNIAAAATNAAMEALVSIPIRDKLALGPADNDDWLTAMGWFAELNPPGLAVVSAHDKWARGERWLSEEQKVLVWRARRVSWRIIAEALREYEGTVLRWWRQALERIEFIANSDPQQFVLAKHIALVQQRNREFKRQGEGI
jgi:hypothetical protein